jgi:hypothetical protein
MLNLAEDPTYVAGGLLLLAGTLLIALNLTQQGKYLIRAGIAFGLAIVVVLVEWLWVTDRERIEKVVYDLGRAVQQSDVEGVLSHMASNVQYLEGDTALREDTTRALIRANLNQTQFDFLRISDLQISAGQQSRRGQAEFRVIARGHLSSIPSMGDRTSVTTWSLGFQETNPGVWKVNRISPISIPHGALVLPGGQAPTDGSHLGYNDGISPPRDRSGPWSGRRYGFRRRGLANLSSKLSAEPGKHGATD